MTSADEFAARLPAVQRALYLLFNEGYHGASMQTVVRVELCREAIRLAGLLVEHSFAQEPGSDALASLMSLDAVRLPARVSEAGNLISLDEQDRSLWDQELVRAGLRLLDLSACGSELTAYYIEAAIAAVHARARPIEDTDWNAIVSLYDTLMTIRPTPIVALNRAIAISQQEGPERGID